MLGLAGWDYFFLTASFLRSRSHGSPSLTHETQTQIPKLQEHLRNVIFKKASKPRVKGMLRASKQYQYNFTVLGVISVASQITQILFNSQPGPK